ncbi:MAG: hypothetical protein C0417_01955 [Chlorobiaceae bacterium]|nr:hypothetical protein [Chlorobiaceae bacterium]
MNITDILIAIGVLFFVALGVRDGFFKKLYGIIGFIGGLVAATKFMSPLAEIFVESLGISHDGAMIFAFFIIFAGIILIANLFYRWFGQSSGESVHLWSRIAGGLLGAAQGLLAVSLILVMLDFFQIPEEETKKESILYYDVYPLAPTIFDYTTRWMPDSKRFFDEIKGKIETVKMP